MLRIPKYKAFSLIEVSVVLLIVGILIAGISQGVDLYLDMKLNVARQLTNSSRVPRIEGLIFWSETSLEKSMPSSQAKDSSQISQWNDINPFSSQKFFLVRNPSNFITYKSKGIGNIPSIYYDGNGGTLNLSTTNLIGQATFFKTENQKIDIFLVTKGELLASSESSRVFFTNGNTSTAGISFFQSNLNKYRLLFGGINLWDSTNSYDFSSESILYFSYGGTGSTSLKLYRNGAVVPFPSFGSNPNNPSGSFALGGNNTNNNESFKGFISEFIVYERNLRNDERIEIERYLGKKYGIVLK